MDAVIRAEETGETIRVTTVDGVTSVAIRSCDGTASIDLDVPNADALAIAVIAASGEMSEFHEGGA